MEQEIEKCAELLQAGKVLLYPTDTVWGIGCDATNEEAIMKIYHIKQRDEKKSMIILRCWLQQDFMIRKFSIGNRQNGLQNFEITRQTTIRCIYIQI